MKTKTLLRQFFILVLLALLSPAAFAQATHVSLTQAVQMGVANSKQLKLDTAKLTQAQLRETIAADNALPEVRLNAGYTRLSDITPLVFQLPNSPEPVTLYPNIPNTYNLSASLRQPIFSGWRLKYTQESYGYITKAAQLDVDKDKAEIQLNVISAYLNLVRLRLSQQIVGQSIQSAQTRVQEVSAMRDKGIATENDVLKSQLYQSNLELSKSDIDNSVSVAQYSLCILLGLPENTVIESDTTGIFSTISLLTEQAYEQNALSNRSEAKAADYRLQATQTNIKVAQAAYYPTVSLGADYVDARPNQRIFPPTDEFRTTWDVGVQLSWNITSLYTAKHSVQDAQLQTMQAQTQSDLLDDNIRMDVFQNFITCQNAINKIATLELAVKQAEENSRQVQAKYNQQATLMSEVLDADAALLQARINLLMQRADAQLAYQKLLKSAGMLQ